MTINEYENTSSHENIRVFDRVFPTSKNSRKTTVDTISKFIHQSCNNLELTPDETYLAIDEALTNAMEHGNKWDPQKQIHIEIFIQKSFVTIRITDEGQGFDVNSIQKLIKKRDLLSTRGRGIYIISQFCKTDWNKKGNRIDLAIQMKN